MLLLPVAIWFTLAPAALPGWVDTFAVFTPGYVLIAATMAAAAGAHLLLARQLRLFGASVVGVLLLAIAALNAWYATLPGLPTGDAASIALLVRLVLYLLTALAMQLMTFEDMTYELQHANRRLATAQDDLRQMVVTDALTGTRNRRFFNEVIGRELQRHRRYQTPLSIVFIDIDRFKAINDTLGHETGDRVLREVAAFLLKNIREADYVFRWGGDEFLVLMSCGEDEARRRGRRACSWRSNSRRMSRTCRKEWPSASAASKCRPTPRTSWRWSRPPTSGCTPTRSGSAVQARFSGSRVLRFQVPGSIEQILRAQRAPAGLGGAP